MAVNRSSGSIRLYADTSELQQFVAALRQIQDRGIRDAMADEFRDASRLMSQRSRAVVPARLASSIQPVSTQTSASVRTRPTARAQDALARIWGAQRRSGWYAWRRYDESTSRQFPRWVGNRWAPGAQRGKPYFIGDPINRTTDELPERLAARLESLFT